MACLQIPTPTDQCTIPWNGIHDLGTGSFVPENMSTLCSPMTWSIPRFPRKKNVSHLFSRSLQPNTSLPSPPPVVQPCRKWVCCIQWGSVDQRALKGKEDLNLHTSSLASCFAMGIFGSSLLDLPPPAATPLLPPPCPILPLPRPSLLWQLESSCQQKPYVGCYPVCWKLGYKYFFKISESLGLWSLFGFSFLVLLLFVCLFWPWTISGSSTISQAMPALLPFFVCAHI